MITLPKLPVSEVLPLVAQALAEHKRAVLSAPPGAGKTTLVPLRLLDEAWRGDGRIILLEPRRLAARAAAARMASLLGEQVGETVGYRMRLDSRISRKTRIEVVTEGVFARMVLDDPELAGVSTVIFDEFHERSLDADFGLALALDVQSALREDLRLLVMSATLDVAEVTRLLGNAPAIESMGRSFPVDIRYQERASGERVEDAVTKTVIDAFYNEDGSVLVFLPGQAEIRRVAERLAGRLGQATMIVPLYGNLDQRAQDEAIRPAPAGMRKVVLATSIAETSITIDGVRIVIDSGLQRAPVYEPSTGITRLETVRVSRAAADQRAGRAGRTAPGIAIRLWHQGQTAALVPFNPPQILSSDLSGLALDLAHWGVKDAAAMAFADPPPAPALKEARNLLHSTGALDESGALTELGRKMRELALPPRLAAMVLSAAKAGYARQAAMLAVLLTEQGLGGDSIDLDERLRRFRSASGERAEAARALALRLVGGMRAPGQPHDASAGRLLLHAFPDRIAAQRGGRGRFVMANGRGAELAETEGLAGASMLVIADLTGRAAQGRILAAAEIGIADIEAERPGDIIRENKVFFDHESGSVRAREITRIGAIVLAERALPKPDGEAVAAALAEAVVERGIEHLPFSKDAEQLRARVGFLRRALGEPWPDLTDDALAGSVDDWFTPFQRDARSFSSISSAGLTNGLLSLIPYNLQRDLDRLAPSHFDAPTGQRHPIRYDGEEPILTIRVQELFGVKQHPVIGSGQPLLLELTSPAHRPIQMTRDLPGFWTGSWKDVRADMRGRYPRHPWPERPEEALPTHRAKPRGT